MQKAVKKPKWSYQMARTPRVLITGDPTAYHVMFRTALDGYHLSDVEKEHFVTVVKQVSKLYFVEVLEFTCMGNHFHILVRMRSEMDYLDAELKKRLADFYGEKRVFGDGQLPSIRRKMASLSEYVREIKMRFARFYNKCHGRRGILRILTLSAQKPLSWRPTGKLRVPFKRNGRKSQSPFQVLQVSIP
jgi:hypothetical protein